MNNTIGFQEQLDRMLEMLFYLYHRHESLDMFMFTLETFCRRGRPLNDHSWKLVDREFVRKGVIDYHILDNEANYDD